VRPVKATDRVRGFSKPPGRDEGEHDQPATARSDRVVSRSGRTATPPPQAISIHGGTRAPGEARSYVLEQLGGWLSDTAASDAALLVSELVTNSVLHAAMGPTELVLLELMVREQVLRIAVTDQGTNLEPRLLPIDPAAPGGFGLRLVDQMSSTWGVVRGGDGTTCVWCELPIGGPAAPPRPNCV